MKMLGSVPVLVVSAPTAGVLQVNGVLAGEIKAGERISMPVSPNGDVYLLFVPYENDLPAAQKLRFVHGQLQIEDSPNPIVWWPEGVAELHFQPASGALALPPRMLDTLSTDDWIVYLFRMWTGELQLLVESREDDRLLWSRELPDTQTGSLRVLDKPCPMVGALLEGTCGQRLVLLGKGQAEGEVACLMDISGEKLRLREDAAAVTAQTDLRDTAGHQYVLSYRFDPETGRYQKRNETVVWQNGAPHRPETPVDHADAFLQAAGLGLFEEALAYLDRDYAKQLTKEDLALFLGEFDRIVPARYRIDPNLPAGRVTRGLVNQTARNVSVVRLVALEIQDGAIRRVFQFLPDREEQLG